MEFIMPNKYNNEPMDLTYNRFSGILCERCVFAKKDFVSNGRVIFKGATNMRCDKYINEKKPVDIILGKTMECQFFKAK